MRTQRSQRWWSTNLVISLLLKPSIAQNGGPPAQFSCYRCFGMAMGVVTSVGLDNNDLCATSGPLYSLISSGQSCLSTVVTSVPVPNFDLLNSALSRCNSEVGASSQSICASLSAQNQPCEGQISYFGQALVMITSSGAESRAISTATPVQSALWPVVSTTSIASAAGNNSWTTTSRTQSPTQSLTSSPSSATSGVIGTSNAPAHSTNVRLIVGVAIGSALGGIILVLFLAILFWRCRRQRRQSIPIVFRSPHPAPPPPPTYTSKPSLRDFESPDSGPIAPYYTQRNVRAVRGVQELESPEARTNVNVPWKYATSDDHDAGMRTWYSSGTSDDGHQDRYRWV